MGGTSVEDLQPGDHACLMFSDAEERLDIVAAFVRDGLRAGEKVLCLTEALSAEALAAQFAQRGIPTEAAGQDGQLLVTTSAGFFVPQGTFDAERSIDELRTEIDQARRDGYAGLRVASDMCWALRPVRGLAELMDYETALTRMLADQQATAVCQFDRESFDTVTISAAVDAHGLTVAAVTYHDDALLRICRQHVPTGIRVAGAIDYRAADPLTRALTEALSLDNHIVVNLTQLRFIDTFTAGLLVQAAVALSEGQRMTIRCGGMILEVLRALGMDEVAGVSLVVPDEH